jgi:FlaA1/EpsC-like NDP-sugar epimerase
MTSTDAARLVMFAGAVAESSETYVLDMGEPVRIVELVKSLAFVMRVPKADVEISFSGLRDGEKLSEELFFDDESRQRLGNSQVFRVSRPGRPLAEVRQWLGDLKGAILGEGPEAARGVLMEIAALDSTPASVGIAPLGEDDGPQESRL